MEQLTDRDEPRPVLLDEDWSIVEGLLPLRWMEMARESKALQRARGFADARALLKVMLIHLASGRSLRDTAARAEAAGLADVSDVALLKRLRSCGPWFEWICQRLREACEPRGAHTPRDADNMPPAVPARLLGERRLRVDGSIVHEPGPTGTQWRLHYAIGLPGLQCQEVHVGPSSQGETLKRFEVHEADIFIADRGYAHPGGIAYVCSRGADVIVRLNLVTLPLYETGDADDAKRFDILAHARRLKTGQAGCWPVSVRPRARTGSKDDKCNAIIQGRLCVVRKSQQAAAQSRDARIGMAREILYVL